MDLDPISEVFEEEFEDCPESVHRLIACLREANEKVKQLSYIEEEVKINQAKQEHLQLLCAEGSAEIEALQQNIAHLSTKVQAKDQELAALLQVNSEFKQLLQSDSKATQTSSLTQSSDTAKSTRAASDSEGDNLSSCSKDTTPQSSVHRPPKGRYVPSTMRKLKKPFL